MLTEVSIINDGLTLSLPSHKCFEDQRVVVLWQEKKGVSAARNAGLQRARGQFVMFVDAGGGTSLHASTTSAGQENRVYQRLAAIHARGGQP